MSASDAINFLIGLSLGRHNSVIPVASIGFANYANVFSDRLLADALKKTGLHTLEATSLALGVESDPWRPGQGSRWRTIGIWRDP